MAKQKSNGVIQRMSQYRPTLMLVTQPYHYNSRQLLSRSVLAVHSGPRDVARIAIFVRFPYNIGVARNQSGCFRLSKDNFKELSQWVTHPIRPFRDVEGPPGGEE